ncbi:hypothetical protein [Rhizobium ruizarguesonis]|nr:hypothetical protein [Rhizobium ruizarguesonis]
MMRKSMQWPYYGVPKVTRLPAASPFHSEGLARELLLALTTPDECKRHVERMVASKVSQYLTSTSRLTTRQAWLELKAGAASEGVEDFLGNRAFYQRVGVQLARMKRHRERKAPSSHCGAAELVNKVTRILMRYLGTPLWPEGS